MTMKLLKLLLVVSLSGTCLGGDKRSLELYGKISKVESKGNKIVLSLIGVGNLNHGDKAITNRKHPLAMHNATVHLTLDARYYETYIRVRYLENLKREEIAPQLEQFRANGTEVFLELVPKSIEYSSFLGGLRPSKISGSLSLVAAWRSMFDETISERHKDLGVSYEKVVKIVAHNRTGPEPTNNKEEAP